MKQLLSQWRNRLLDDALVKPLDIASLDTNMVASVGQNGRVVSLNMPNKTYGYITLNTVPPFDDESRYDSDLVRAYRAQLANASGFGVQSDGEWATSKTWLLEDVIPLQCFTQKDGTEIWCVSFVVDSFLVQLWSTNDNLYLLGDIWLQRSAYTQLTEGGVSDFPEIHYDITLDDVRLTVENTVLDVKANLPFKNIQLADEHRIRVHGELADYPTVDHDDKSYTVLYYNLGDDPLPQEPPLVLLERVLNTWQSRWQDWKFTDHPLDPVLRRAVIYADACCVKFDNEQVCVFTDHVLLPLSWNRDAYYVVMSLLDWREEYAEVVRGHLLWMFEGAQRLNSGGWGRAYFTNGNVKDEAFQLDQQLFPILQLIEYTEIIGDKFLWQRFESSLNVVLNAIESEKHKSKFLWATDETPADDPLPYPYHFSSHILLWYVFKKLGQIEGYEKYADIADRVYSSIQEHFITEYDGKRIYSYATDGEDNHHIYHDANDVPTIYAPIWGFCDVNDPVWQATIDYAFSDANSEGVYDSVLGSIHSRAPWFLGEGQALLVAGLREDTDTYQQIQKRIAHHTQWDGGLSEAYSIQNRAVESRHWFAWPNALIYLVESYLRNQEQK